MISISNYQQAIETIDISKLPQVLREGHHFFKETAHLYPVDETIKETLDLYLESLNKHVTKEKSKTATHRKSKIQPTKDMVFIKRFIDLNKKIISKQQLGAYIQALQHAISRKEIRRSSPLAYHIEQIQNKLINRYNTLPQKGSVKININEQWLTELRAIIDDKPHRGNYLNGFENSPQKRVIPTKKLINRRLGIFDAMDEMENEPSKNTFRLQGDLGKFLGDLERFELAMTIEGDQGGGKTRFVYQLADAFATIGNKVAIFSLEIGRKSDLIRRMREDYVSQGNLKNIFITDQLPNGLGTIKEAAKNFDVVILDSWNKVGVPSQEFDRLRKEHPDTIFIVIFQRTTQKMIRGGTAPLFDAGINIEVVKEDETFSNNYAMTTKNRYGAAGIRYNISQKKITSGAE